MFTVEPVADVVTWLAPWPLTVVLGMPFVPENTSGPLTPGSPPAGPASELITPFWAGPLDETFGPLPATPGPLFAIGWSGGGTG
ncbi:hypothetical protein [Kibdelosporangium philippinense]|uniref:hypothetical protein n=1 Tax=Kibdelosporangium philippinense TaxID=211113 RepID=UPI0035ED3AFA